MHEPYDVIIAGAGPAGLVAAAVAGARGCRVLVLDKGAAPGAKLLIAGGGKGNLTNLRVSPSDYVGAPPSFLRFALGGTTPEQVLAHLREGGIRLEEREHGQIFCATSARDVLHFLVGSLPSSCRLLTEMPVTGVHVHTEETASPHASARFTVSCGSRAFTGRTLILATGSPAWPQCGADDSGLRLARALGHKIIPPRPVLVPFVLPPGSPFASLAGISVPVRIRMDVADSPSFTLPLLFTHKGISGPAALQISCFWRKDTALVVDFLPGERVEELLDAAKGKATPASLLARRLPERLWRVLIAPDLAQRRVAELSRKDRTAVAASIHEHRLLPQRTEGMHRAEAAAGGVDTAQVSPRTLASTLVPGLFFCGEMLDVTGRLGGYNLHWAWASGTLAGKSAAATQTLRP